MPKTLQTLFDFTLPMGYVDEKGTLHKKGTIRLATAADEILPMKDPRVEQNPTYLTVIIFSRVISSLGDLKSITPKTIEDLFAGDFAYLQDMYNRINQNGSNTIKTSCPKCKHKYKLEVQTEGEE